MTSEINNAATVAAFEDNDYFGLPKESVHFIVQGLIAAVDNDGKILLSDKTRRTPDGHGGSLRALVRSGAAAKMEALGVDCVSWFQVDNPLIRIIIGLCRISCAGQSGCPKMIPAYPLKGGHFCAQDGRMWVSNTAICRMKCRSGTTEDGSLLFIAGSG